MNYKIGELITEHIQKQNVSYRRYALERGLHDNVLTQLRMGHKAASGKVLSQLIDLELLREPLTNEIMELLKTIDTETIIHAYNIIYSKERDK